MLGFMHLKVFVIELIPCVELTTNKMEIVKVAIKVIDYRIIRLV